MEINDKGFYVKINDFIPISNLIIKFDEPHPKQIILDSNDNKIYDEKDMYFFPDQNGKFRINLKLFSNRIPINNNLLTSDNSMIIGNTKFNFLVENNSKPTELIEFNEYTKKSFLSN